MIVLKITRIGIDYHNKDKSRAEWN